MVFVAIRPKSLFVIIVQGFEVVSDLHHTQGMSTSANSESLENSHACGAAMSSARTAEPE